MDNEVGIDPRRLQAAIDRSEIIDICIRKHWYVDRKLWDRLGEVMAPEVSVPSQEDFRSPGPDGQAHGRVRPLEHFRAGMEVLMDGLQTQHIVAGHHVEIDGDSAVCYANAYNMHIGTPDFANGSQENRVVHGSAYEFRLARTPDGWRITSLRSMPIWAQGNELVHNNGQRQAELLRELDAGGTPTEGTRDAPPAASTAKGGSRGTP